MAAPIVLLLVSFLLCCHLGAGEILESFYEDGTSLQYLDDARNDDMVNIVAGRHQDTYLKDEGQGKTGQIEISTGDGAESIRKEVKYGRTNHQSVKDGSNYDKKRLVSGKETPLFGRESLVLRSYTPVVVRGSKGVALLQRNNPTFTRYSALFGKDMPAFGKDVVALKMIDPVLGKDTVFGRDTSVHEVSGPLFGKDHPLLRKDSPYFGKDSPVLGRDTPFFGKDHPFMGKDNPLFGKDSPILGKDSPLFGKDNPVLGKHTPLLRKDTTILENESPLFGKDNPFFGKNGRILGKDNPHFGKRGRIVGKDNPFFGKSGRILGKDSAERYRLKEDKQFDRADSTMRRRAEKGGHATREDHPMFGRDMNREISVLGFKDAEKSSPEK